jgi:hypothetical protein
LLEIKLGGAHVGDGAHRREERDPGTPLILGRERRGTHEQDQTDKTLSSTSRTYSEHQSDNTTNERDDSQPIRRLFFRGGLVDKTTGLCRCYREKRKIKKKRE